MAVNGNSWGGCEVALGPWQYPWYSDLQLGFVQNDTGDRAVCPGEWRPAGQGPESRCKVRNIRGGTCQTEPVYFSKCALPTVRVSLLASERPTPRRSAPNRRFPHPRIPTAAWQNV